VEQQEVLVVLRHVHQVMLGHQVVLHALREVHVQVGLEEAQEEDNFIKIVF
jgi:hypothetical protein